MGASVGEVCVEVGGREAGSISRSGIGGERSGLVVILSSVNRRSILEKCIKGRRAVGYSLTAYLTVSRNTIPLQRFLSETLLLRSISTRS